MSRRSSRPSWSRTSAWVLVPLRWLWASFTYRTVEPSLLCRWIVRRYMLATRPHELGECNPNVCPHSGGLPAVDKPLTSDAVASRALTCPSTAEPGGSGDLLWCHSGYAPDGQAKRRIATRRPRG